MVQHRRRESVLSSFGWFCVHVSVWGAAALVVVAGIANGIHYIHG